LEWAQRGEVVLLASAYRTALELAAAHGCGSVALPALSTGAHRYPISESAQVAINTIAEYLERSAIAITLSTVRFVLFSVDVQQAFEDAARRRRSL
jgi:O-acetyl-ADP-ribose deacetylase (regulator of RNase III)